MVKPTQNVLVLDAMSIVIASVSINIFGILEFAYSSY